MNLDDVDQWGVEFENFHGRFAHLFARSEPREAAGQYLCGLLASVRRKNCWQMAEVLGARDPQGMQRLLYSAHWDADAARDELVQFVIEAFGADNGICVMDETGFLKKGEKSVGVKRQYTGTAGKVENCQVAVFLSYFSRRGYTFLDRRLYLPKEWCSDWERRREAKVPDEVTFSTKPELAGEMLKHAWAEGVPMAWVTGDTVYGDATHLRDTIDQAGKKYILGVSSNTPFWRERPPLEEPVKRAQGRPRKRPRLAADAPAWETAAAIVASLSEGTWERLTVSEGEKGPRVYDWARLRVVESRDALPGPEGWLLARRSLTDATDMAYYVSNAPRETPLQTLTEVASTRWSIETTIEEGKGETGLDEYEVRYWHSWHRHITLSMIAHAWLAFIRQRAGEKPAGPGTGRGERAGSTSAPAGGVATATRLPRTALGLVPLATGEAAASSAQSLSATGCPLA